MSVSVCLSACLSDREHISGSTRPTFTKFSVLVICDGKVTVGLVMPHRRQWYIRLRSRGLRKRDQHPAQTPHGVCHILHSFISPQNVIAKNWIKTGCKNVRVWSELIVELGLQVSRLRSGTACERSGVGVKTVRTVGAGKLLTAECARVIHSGVRQPQW